MNIEESKPLPIQDLEVECQRLAGELWLATSRAKSMRIERDSARAGLRRIDAQNEILCEGYAKLLSSDFVEIKIFAKEVVAKAAAVK